jgi:vesicle-associated membrane protein 4
MSSEPYDPYIPNGEGAPASGGQGGAANTAQIRQDLEGARVTLAQNTQMLGQRGAHLDNLQDKTNNLAESARGFNRSANQVRKKMWWKDMKMRIWLGVGIVVLLCIIIIPTVVTTSK